MPQNTPKKGNPVLWIVLIVVVLIAVAAILYFGDFFNTNTNSNANTTGNANTNTINSANVNSNAYKDNWQKYNNVKYSYSYWHPESWTLKTYDDNTPNPTLTSSAQSSCVTNFEPDISTYHPQKGEIQVCVNIFLNNGQVLKDWYTNYRGLNTTELYNKVTTSDVTLNGQTAIKEEIITGSQPNTNVDTEWLDGTLQTFYMISGGYIVALTATVTADSTQLLSTASDIADSINW